MDTKEYINNLKNTNLRPKKIKIKETILLEQTPTKGESDIHAQIISFFQSYGGSPSDDDVHSLAMNLGIEPDELEDHIYMLLGDIIAGGKSKDFKGTYDPKELDMGRKVELEHTKEPLIAEKIAKDHLSEIKDYYTRLAKMESEAGVVHELFVQQGEIEAMPAGERRDMAILRIAMIAELDAASFYERLGELAENESVKKIMFDVANEEKVHAGEFETLLEEVDPDYEEMEEEGEDEVEDVTGI